MNQEQLFIVTGTSRGLGAALAQQLLQPGTRLLGIARQANDALQQRADFGANPVADVRSA